MSSGQPHTPSLSPPSQGNSGGPLVDVETGQVVGINAAIRAHMEGTSFAIPINRIRAIMYDLAQGRQIHHGYLGISLATCTPDWARQNNLEASDAPSIPEVYGALIHKVFPRVSKRYTNHLSMFWAKRNLTLLLFAHQTPAEKGGLRENDVLLEIAGKKVSSSDDARRIIDGAPIGKVSDLVRQ